MWPGMNQMTPTTTTGMPMASWPGSAAVPTTNSIMAPQPTLQQQKNDIFVGNLAFTTTEEQLHTAFSDIGRIIKVRMVTDLETGKPRGFAFIEFEDPQAALSAIRNMNDYELNGRRIRVNFSNSSHLETLAGKLGMDMSSTISNSVSAGGKKEDGMMIASSNGMGVGGGVGTAGASSGTIPSAMDSSSSGTQAIANALKSLSKGEMYDIIAKLKEIADRDPDEARKLISCHPQLPEAILHCMSKLDIISNPLPTHNLMMDPTSTTASTIPPPLMSATTTANASNPALPGVNIIPPPLNVPVPIRQDPRTASMMNPPQNTTTAATTTSLPITTTTTTSASRPADPRARDPRAAARLNTTPSTTTSTTAPQPTNPLHPSMMVPPQQQQQQQPNFMHQHHPIIPPQMNSAFPPPPPVMQQQQQQQPPPPSLAGLDPSLIQQVMGLTMEQIGQLPPDKQQSILALRQQITQSLGGSQQG